MFKTLKSTLKSLGAPLLSVLLIASCATAYRSKEVEKSLNRGTRDLEKLEKNLGADLKSKAKIMECFSGAEEKDAGLSLQEKLTKLDASREKILGLKARMNTSMDRARSTVKGKKMVSSQEPEFKSLEKELGSLQKDSENLNDELNNYNKVSKALYADAKKQKLLLADFDEFAKSLDRSSANTSKVATDGKKEIEAIQKKFKASKIKNKDEKIAKLEEMKKLLTQAEEEVKEANDAGKELQAAYPAKGLVCLSPKNPSYAYIQKLNDNSSRLNVINKELRRLSAEISKD
jgi:hypothetical protein